MPGDDTGASRRAVFLLRALIVLVVGVSQALGTQATKSAFRNGLSSPFALSWLTTTCGVALGLPALLARLQRSRRLTRRGDSDDDDDGEVEVRAAEPGRWMLLRAVAFYGMYAAANVSYQVALQHEDAAVVAAVFSAAPAFVCVLSWVLLPAQQWEARNEISDRDGAQSDLLDERPSIRRRVLAPMLSDSVSAVLAVSGILIAVHPWSASVHSGPYVALASASPVMAALYKVLFARLFPGASPRRVGEFLARIGLLNATLGTCVLALAWSAFDGRADVQRMIVPDNFAALPWGRIALVCACSVTFNLSVNYGVTVMPPLMVSIGTVLSTALNIAYEAASEDTVPSGAEWGGIALICSSLFVLLGSSAAFAR